MSLISEQKNGKLTKDLCVKVIKKVVINNPKNASLKIFKTLMTDGIEFVQVVQFANNIFSKINEHENVILESFMVRESNKDAFWIKLNTNNIHVETNSASKVTKTANKITNNITSLAINCVGKMSVSEKSLMSVKAVLLNTKEDIFGIKKRTTCNAFDLEGKNISKVSEIFQFDFLFHVY